MIVWDYCWLDILGKCYPVNLAVVAGGISNATALAAEIPQLKDPTKLAEKFRELKKLRQAIDQAAPDVLGKFQQAKTRKQESLKAAQ